MTPSLKELALAAVEARTRYEKTDHSLNTEFFEWQKIKAHFTASATPQRILQYRNEVLEVVLKALGRFSLQTEIIDAAEALKTEEPPIENYDKVDGKFVLCPTCGALPCDWGNDLNYRTAVNEVKL